MFKSSLAIVKPANQPIKVDYNNGKCYKCNKTDKLQPLLEEGGRFVFCMRCKVNLILYDVLTEDEYSKIVLEKMNYKFNDKIKKDSFNKFVNNMNAYI